MITRLTQSSGKRKTKERRYIQSARVANFEETSASSSPIRIVRYPNFDNGSNAFEMLFDRFMSDIKRKVSYGIITQ
jgi:hypothetical protein